jgi:hypothetical protein
LRLIQPSQKLYRVLELISRLKYPITHSPSEVSPGELKLVELKFIAILKKVFVN